MLAIPTEDVVLAANAGAHTGACSHNRSDLARRRTAVSAALPSETGCTETWAAVRRLLPTTPTTLSLDKRFAFARSVAAHHAQAVWRIQLACRACDRSVCDARRVRGGAGGKHHPGWCDGATVCPSLTLWLQCCAPGPRHRPSKPALPTLRIHRPSNMSPHMSGCGRHWQCTSSSCGAQETCELRLRYTCATTTARRMMHASIRLVTHTIVDALTSITADLPSGRAAPSRRHSRTTAAGRSHHIPPCIQHPRRCGDRVRVPAAQQHASHCL